jgi:hypothetical protein
MLRKWDKLRSLVLRDDVVGYSNETLGHALTSGNLKNLVTLEVSVDYAMDPGYLDSDVYRWCTPSLEYFTVYLDAAKAVDRRRLRQRKFFVNLPRLRRLSVTFNDEFCIKPILENIPESVAELEINWFVDGGESLPPVLQPGLEKLSVRGHVCDLRLQYR